jgi:uncharacterized membrane protein
MAKPGNFRPLLIAGILLGFGVAAFAEATVFRHLFQTHDFLSGRFDTSTIEGLRSSLHWGGIFEFFYGLLILVSLRLLWKSGRRGDVPWRGKALLGSVLLGFGFFLCAEGVVGHQILGLHHVVEKSPWPFRVYWDIAYLAVGALSLGFGGEIIRKDHQHFLKRKREWSDGRRALAPVSGAQEISRR